MCPEVGLLCDTSRVNPARVYVFRRGDSRSGVVERNPAWRPITRPPLVAVSTSHGSRMTEIDLLGAISNEVRSAAARPVVLVTTTVGTVRLARTAPAQTSGRAFFLRRRRRAGLAEGTTPGRCCVPGSRLVRPSASRPSRIASTSEPAVASPQSGSSTSPPEFALVPDRGAGPDGERQEMPCGVSVSRLEPGRMS